MLEQYELARCIINPTSSRHKSELNLFSLEEIDKLQFKTSTVVTAARSCIPKHRKESSKSIRDYDFWLPQFYVF